MRFNEFKQIYDFERYGLHVVKNSYFFSHIFVWKWYTFYVKLTPFAKCISRWFSKNLVCVPHLLDDVYAWNLIWSRIFTNFQYWLLLLISHKSFLLISHNYLHFNNFVRKSMSFKTHSAPSFLEYFYYILILQWFSSLIFRMHIGFLSFLHICNLGW